MKRRRWVLLAVVLLLGALTVLSTVSGRIVDWVWFDRLGYGVVFWKILWTQVGLFGLGAAVALLYTWLHFRWALRGLKASGETEATLHLPGGEVIPMSLGQLRLLAFVFAGIAAFLLGSSLAVNWNAYLLLRWGGDFGSVEPIFRKDIGFYVFRLPLYELIQNALTVLTGWVFAALILFYGISQLLVAHDEARLSLRSPPLRHLSVAFVAFVACWGWGYYLERYGLLLSPDGAVFGAGYTDVYVLKYALWIMVAASAAVGGVAIVGAFLKGARMTLSAVIGYVALLVVVLWAWPGAVQSFRVKPNELELETPFLEHNIAFTRAAYGLTGLQEKDYPARGELTYEQLRSNRETLHNIRLWDWRPLTQTYRQMQEIRLYYRFYEVDIDRYGLEDGYRQVMLSARELSPELPERADTWVNRVLQFTHGYGLAMSLATQVGEDGVPYYIIRDLPPVARSGLEVRQPAIYYGEKTPGYRIVNTQVRELDYPKGDENVYTHYDGTGGIPLDSFWKRLLFAWELGDVNILLSEYITPQSLLQVWRRTQERVSKIAPFLELDPDPYLVLSEGRLAWIQDAYTVTSRYPYSEPYHGGFNYIRNSVKVVVDAYDGAVTLYAVDPEEPILAAYGRAFPGILRPLDEMPADLRRHLRYPVELFRVQVEKLSTYHMTVPQVFYNREDLWTVPREKYAGEAIPVEPYYVLMRLPGGEDLEFLLMSPLTPDNKDNMIAWVAARCDVPHYGELLVYKLPKERLIYGPLQIEAVIDQDTGISQRLSLWDQRGSQVIRGNLLVIPIDRSFLYVEPVYLIAEGTDIPQLRRVIVALGDRVAMEPTLEGAVRSVFGISEETSTAAGEKRPVLEALPEVRDAFQKLRNALREGRWSEFGSAMESLEGMLGKEPEGEKKP